MLTGRASMRLRAGIWALHSGRRHRALGIRRFHGGHHQPLRRRVFRGASSLVEFMKGNIEKATEYNLKRELENPTDSENWYEIARSYGLFEMKEDCYRALKKSIDMGYHECPVKKEN